MELQVVDLDVVVESYVVAVVVAFQHKFVVVAVEAVTSYTVEEGLLPSQTC